MKISIIIHVYNCEEYIKKCIDSIIEQTYKDFEVIIINDGSTDNTNYILNEYKNYSNIIIINQSNHGVSYSRNVGLEKAKGDYICFIDGDDYIDKDYLSTLISHNIDDKYDWIISGIFDFHNNNILKELRYENKEWDMNNINNCIDFYSLKLLTAPFPKLFKRSIIQNHKLKFNTNISFAEDREFNYKYAQYVNCAKSISYIGYYYRVSNPNSLSKKCYPYKLKYDCLHWNILRKIFENKQYNNVLTHKILVNELFHSINDDIKLLTYSYNIKTSTKLLFENTKFIDKSYLIRHKDLIKSSLYLKSLIIYMPNIFILLFHYLFKKKNINR